MIIIHPVLQACILISTIIITIINESPFDKKLENKHSKGDLDFSRHEHCSTNPSEENPKQKYRFGVEARNGSSRRSQLRSRSGKGQKRTEKILAKPS